jgi:hypothetical protein
MRRRPRRIALRPAMGMHDFAAAVQFVIDRHDMSGPVNLAAPDRGRSGISCVNAGCVLACLSRNGWPNWVRSRSVPTP